MTFRNICWATAAVCGAVACGEMAALDDVLEGAALAEGLGGATEQAPPSDVADDGTGPQGFRGPPPGDRFRMDCGMDALRGRVAARHDADGDGTLSDSEAQPLQDQFGSGERNNNNPGGMPPGLGNRPPPRQQDPDGPWAADLPDHPQGGRQPPPQGMEGPPPPPDGLPAGMPGAGNGHPARRGPPSPGRFMAMATAWIYDGDDSGDLSQQERAALHQDMDTRCQAVRARVLADFDQDGDGMLSDAEAEAARAFAQTMHQTRRQNEHATFDADGDGSLSREEHQAACQAHHDAIQQRRQATRTLFDADGSGHLEDAERSALRQQLRERLVAATPWPRMDAWDQPAGMPAAQDL